MKKGAKIFFLVVVVLAAAAAWLLLSDNDSGTIDKELRDFAVSDTATINKVFLSDKSGNSVILTKQENGKWLVNDKFEAREDLVSLLLYTMNKIDVLSPVAKTAQETIIKSLASTSIKVEVYQKDKLTKLYYVGGETQDQTGTYMLLADPETGKNSSVPFILFIPGFNGYLTGRYVTKESDWRAKGIFTYNPEEILSVEVSYRDNPDSQFVLTQHSLNEYTLSNTKRGELQNLDTLAAKQYIGYFRNIQYESLAANMRQSLKDSVLSDGAFATISVTKTSGDKKRIKLFNMPARSGKMDLYGKQMKFDPDRMYALMSDENDFVTVQYFVFGKLMPDLTYFAQKPNI